MRRRRGAQGSLGPYSQLLFRNDLQQSIVPQVARGVATPTFTRATTASVPDFEGKVNTALSGESRFKGARRVENLLAASEDLSNAAWTYTNMSVATGVTDPDGGATAVTLTATAANGTVYNSHAKVIDLDYLPSVWIKRRTGTGDIQLRDGANTLQTLEVTSEWQRFSVEAQTAPTVWVGFLINIAVDADAVDVWHPQLEESTGQSNQNPSEYVSTGVGTGAELVVNGDFATDSDWTHGAGWSISAGALQCSGGGGGAVSTNSATLTIGKTYFVDFTIDAGMTGSASLNAGVAGTARTTAGDFTEVLTATGTALAVQQRGAGFTGSISIVSVKEASHGANVDGVEYFNTLNGNTVTDGAVHYLANGDVDPDYLGDELVTNGDFATDSDWGKGTGWTISGGLASCDGTQGGVTNLSQTLATPSVIGAPCIITFTLSRDAGSITNIAFGGVVDPTNYATDGLKTIYITPTAASTTLYFQGNTSFVGSIDNVSIKQALDNTVIEDTGALINSSTAQFAQLPGASGDYFSTPDSVANSITGDIDIRVKVALDDWPPVATTTLMGKVKNTSNRAYFFDVVSLNKLYFATSTDGSSGAQVAAISTATVPFSNGESGWVRVTRDVDNGAGGNDTTFYTSQDGISWTQLGDVVTVAGTTSIVNNDSPVEIGSGFLGTSQVVEGKIYSAQVYNGIDGTLAVDFNAGDYATGSTWASSETGETWTINGNASIYQGYWDANGPFGYMAEAAATNICLQSNDFSTTWTNITSVDTQNQGTFIDGTNTFNKITDDSAGGTGAVLVRQIVSITANVDMTFSAFVKADQLDICFLRTKDYDAAANGFTYFNLSTGLVGTQSSNHSNATIEALPDGIYRVSITFKSVTDVNGSVYTGPAESDGSSTVDLDGTSSILAGGAQIEAGSFPTAYIPTTTTAVTRNADVLTYDDAGNIEDAAGTAYAEASTDWSTTVAATVVLARGVSGTIYTGPASASTENRAYDGSNLSEAPTGTARLNSSQPAATTWGDALTSYSSGTLLPDPTPAAYDGALGVGDIGIGNNNAGTNQWSGTIRNVKIYSNEKSDAEVLLLG